MRKTRKAPSLLAGLTALCLVASLFGYGMGTAQAADTTVSTTFFSDVTGEQAQYLSFLGALGIFRGDAGFGGPCRPNSTLTRKEFAVVVVRMLGKEAQAELFRDVPTPFTDNASIPRWARGEINVCYNEGIITGIANPGGGFRFEPDSQVTGVQCVAMLTRAMKNDKGPTGVWPFNYMSWGLDTGLIPESDPGEWDFISTNANVTRAQMAALTYNALFLHCGFEPASTPAQWVDPAHPYYTRAPLADDFMVYGQLLSYDLAAKTVTLAPGGALDLADRLIIGGDSLDSFLLRDVFAVLRAGKVVYIGSETPGTTVRGTFASWVGPVAPEGYTYIELQGGQRVRYTGATLISRNNEPAQPCPVVLNAGSNLTITVENGVATYVRSFYEDYPNLVVTDVDVFAAPAPGGHIGNVTLGTNGGAVLFKVYADTVIKLNGLPSSLADLRDYDIVYVASIAELGVGALEISAMRDQVSGEVKEAPAKSWTSPTDYEVIVTVEVRPGVTRDLTMDPLIKDFVFAHAGVGETWYFCLNRSGLARYADEVPGPPPEVLVAKLTQFQDRAAPNKDILSLDDHGVAKQFPTTIDPVLVNPYIGYVCFVLIVDGEAVDFDPVDHIDAYWQVLSVDRTARTMTIRILGGSEVRFINNPNLAVYQWNNAVSGGWKIAGHIGWSGLSVGDWLVIDDETPTVFVLRMWNGDPEPAGSPGPAW
jgi:hypothetical protein